MKLLCSSSDLGELQGLVKRLVHLGIPCAVCKDPTGSQLGVWIQQDSDFPLALKIYAEREKRRPLPHWASVLDLAVPPAKAPAAPAPEPRAEPATDGASAPTVMVLHLSGSTWTGSA